MSISGGARYLSDLGMESFGFVLVATPQITTCEQLRGRFVSVPRGVSFRRGRLARLPALDAPPVPR